MSKCGRLSNALLTGLSSADDGDTADIGFFDGTADEDEGRPVVDLLQVGGIALINDCG
jgi:hypothetical protein